MKNFFHVCGLHVSSTCRSTALAITSVLALAGCALAPGMFAGDIEEGGVIVARDQVSGEALAVQVREISGNELGVSPARRSDHIVSPPFENYRLGAGDVVSVTIWEHPELTIPQGEFRSAEGAGNLIDEEGMMFFPYCGRFMAAGLTRADLRFTLQQCLAKVLRNPQVDVRVVRFRSQLIRVEGAISKPGAVPLTDIPVFLADAIEQAGGLMPLDSNLGAAADPRFVSITRGKVVYKVDFKAYSEEGKSESNPRLLAGDIVHVGFANERRVNVLGEVARPQVVFLNDTMETLADVLAEVQGLSSRTSEPDRILVMRQNGLAPVVHWLRGNNALSLAAAQRFYLQDGDLVYVDQTGLNRWATAVGQMLSFFALVNQGSAAATR